MKNLYLSILLNVFAIGLVWAQPQPLTRVDLDSLNVKMDSLVEKTIKRVEKAHGAGASVGADGPWILEKKALQKTMVCIQRATTAQAGIITGCLESLRARYEQERAERISSVTRLANTLNKPLFLTKDHQLIHVVNFLDKELPRFAADKNLATELAHTLHWKGTPQELDRLTRQFIEQMQIWKVHLEQDTNSSN